MPSTRLAPTSMPLGTMNAWPRWHARSPRGPASLGGSGLADHDRRDGREGGQEPASPAKVVNHGSFSRPATRSGALGILRSPDKRSSRNGPGNRREGLRRGRAARARNWARLIGGSSGVIIDSWSTRVAPGIGYVTIATPAAANSKVRMIAKARIQGLAKITIHAPSGPAVS